jgi:hypothetical protein
MLNYIQRFFQRWVKRQFHGNPLVEDTGPYLHKVGQAFHFWIRAVFVLMAGMILFCIIFIVGTLYGWF